MKFPLHLKEPTNYEKINKAIFEAGVSLHSHSEVGEWNKCFHCQRKQKDRAEVMRKLGFVDGRMYLEWKKRHEIIRGNLRMPIEKYNT